MRTSTTCTIIAAITTAKNSARLRSTSSPDFATVAAMTTANSVSNVQAAIIGVSTLRATMGSDQAHLQYQSSALQNYSENISASESRIRNVDMAQESTNFSKFQIQVQAGTAMLAQANQLPQSVLRLLQ